MQPGFRQRFAVARSACAAVALLLAGAIVTSAQAPPRPRFIDIAAKSSIAYVSNNSFNGRKYFPQPMCGGIAVFDYDHDGKMDIYFTNGAKLPELRKTDPSFHSCLLRNRGDGTFEDVTRKSRLEGTEMDFSYGVAAGDYDNDGHTDLFICNTGKDTLYHNNGDGAFTDVTARSGISKPKDTLSVVAAWFDYDRDGLLDLVVSMYTFWTPQIDRVCKFLGDREAYCNPGVYPSVPHRLYRNLGGGQFEDVTEKSGFAQAPGKGMGVSIADFNNDRWQDVFIANDTEPNLLFMNQGNGAFEEQGLMWGVAYNDQAARVSAMGSDAKDYDNDGFVDIFYNNLMFQIWALFHNESGKRFRYLSPRTMILRESRRRSGWSNGFIDYNNDGWKDIYSANGDVDDLSENARQSDTMFENLEGKDFKDVSSELGKDFAAPGFHRGSAFADLNNDGFMDIIVTGLNERPRILLNSADNGHHWVLFDLTGTKSPRDAIGAGIKLTTGSGRVLHNHVAVSVGFMGSSDRRVHFGLGAETEIKEVEILWPSGRTQVLSGVKADRIVRITEPAD